jgi:hypothetical protein
MVLKVVACHPHHTYEVRLRGVRAYWSGKILTAHCELEKQLEVHILSDELLSIIPWGTMEDVTFACDVTEEEARKIKFSKSLVTVRVMGTNVSPHVLDTVTNLRTFESRSLMPVCTKQLERLIMHVPLKDGVDAQNLISYNGPYHPSLLNHFFQFREFKVTHATNDEELASELKRHPNKRNLNVDITFKQGVTEDQVQRFIERVGPVSSFQEIVFGMSNTETKFVDKLFQVYFGPYALQVKDYVDQGYSSNRIVEMFAV